MAFESAGALEIMLRKIFLFAQIKWKDKKK